METKSTIAIMFVVFVSRLVSGYILFASDDKTNVSFSEAYIPRKKYDKSKSLVAEELISHDEAKEFVSGSFGRIKKKNIYKIKFD